VWLSTVKSECGELFSCAWNRIILHWIPDSRITLGDEPLQIILDYSY